MSRPKGSKNKKTLERMLNESKNAEVVVKKPSISKQIKSYLIEHGEISVDKAINDFKWYRIQQYIAEFRKSGMPIKSIKNGEHITYVLENTKVKVKKEAIEVKPSIEDVKNRTEIKSVKKTQKETILEHLKEFGSISPIQARDLYNVLNLSQTIKSLKNDGYKISTSTERSFKSQNTKIDRMQTCSIYTLESKTKTTKKYVIFPVYDGAYTALIPNYNDIFENKEDAIIEKDRVVTKLTSNLNEIAGSEMFINKTDIMSSIIIRLDKTKGLFKTKIKSKTIASFSVKEVSVEV